MILVFLWGSFLGSGGLELCCFKLVVTVCYTFFFGKRISLGSIALILEIYGPFWWPSPPANPLQTSNYNLYSESCVCIDPLGLGPFQ